jgi:hypothetical protein
MKMPSLYALNGDLVLTRVTLTSSDGSTIENRYLFKVPYSLIESTAPIPKVAYERNAHLAYLIDQDKSEWEAFVTFSDSNVLSWTIAKEPDPSFSLPELPFREKTTTHGICVYQITNPRL